MLVVALTLGFPFWGVLILGVSPLVLGFGVLFDWVGVNRRREPAVGGERPGNRRMID